MNPVDSDLEEGEILDDSPSSSPSHNKHQELPRRYTVHEKATPIHKHKKDCKYAKNSHVKIVGKKTKLKNCRKRHHKSTCSREKSRRPFDRNSTNIEKNFEKNDHSFPNYTLISEIKGSLRDHSIKKQSTKFVCNSKDNVSEAKKLKNDSSTSDVNRENVDNQLESSSSTDSKHNTQQTNNNTEVIVLSSDSDSTPNTNINASVSCINTSENSSKEKDEETEDEEELRRIALATCAKRKVITESSENSVKNADSNSVSISESSPASLQTLNHEMSSPSSDNYDVVDMEVDEDIEAAIEILDNSGKNQHSEYTENLFVIDTKPSESVQENSVPELPTTRNSSDEDFETDILRAELIESLYRKKGLLDECTEKKKSSAKMLQKQVNTLPEKKPIGKYKKLNNTFYHKQLRPGKHTIRKTIINKTENLQVTPSKPSSPVLVNNNSERLVIALNEESSEDSDDSESENPVASIEALISDCRQKSDSNEKAQDIITNVPKAVSCLSKAQQEEYTTLMKILAQKEKLQVPSDALQHRNGSVHLHLNELKLLQRQLEGCKVAVKKKKELASYLSREVDSKKLLYMKSKLAAQQLKQQYLAADKIRKTNLCAWSKSVTDLKNAKKSVSSLESKIIQLKKKLKIQFSKVSAHMPGRTLNTSSLPSGNK